MSSETPGPGEGDLRGEVERLNAYIDARLWESNVADAVADVERLTLERDAAVEQRTLAGQAALTDAADALAAEDEDHATYWKGQAVRWLRRRAALADPEADR